MNKRIVISATKSFCKYNSELINKLTKEGFKLIYDSWPAQKVPMEDIVGLVVSTQKVDRNSITLAKNLKIIAKYGAGYDNIDADAASKSGIYVAVTGDANAEAVAEMALSLMLSVSRNIVIADKQIRSGHWNRYTGRELYGKKVGVIGLGAIGRAFIKRVSSFEVNLLGYDPFWNEQFAEQYKIKRVEINDIFKYADFISLHCPLTPETKGLVNKNRLKLMKSNAYIINTSRGPIINEQDLYKALSSNIIAGAAIDVFEKEPPQLSPLFRLDNIIFTSHMGAYTYEAFLRMDQRTVANIMAVLSGESTEFIVNIKDIRKKI